MVMGKRCHPRISGALIALGGLLERYLDPQIWQQGSPHEDLLARIVGYWGRRLLGSHLTRQEVRVAT